MHANRLCCLLIVFTLAGCATAPEPSGGTAPQPAPAPAPVAEPAPAPAPVPAPVPVPTSEKVAFTANVLFPAGSSSLVPAGKAELAIFLNKIGGSSAGVFVVVGHSDTGVAAAAAKRLSMRRADAVRDYMVARGIDASRIYAEAKGSTQPVATNKTAAGRAENNRVTVEVVGTRSLAVDADAWMPNNVVPVLYATNRQRTGSTNPFYFYGNRLAGGDAAESIERGIAVVRVPRERERGAIERPASIKLIIERGAQAAGIDGLSKLVLPNPDTDFLYEHKIQVLKKDTFNKALTDAVAVSKSKTAVLYVHGYNNDFTDAAFRTAQIAYDLAEVDYDIVPLMFTWPSNPGLVGWNYPTAEKRTEESGYALADYLREIARATDIGTVHIVAHSMGSQVLGTALMKLGAAAELSGTKDGKSTPVFRHIVFAAADIPPKIFNERIAPAIKARHTVTSYISSNDKVLWASKIRNGEPRVGFTFKDLANCVDTIDVTAAASGLAHSTWAESPRVLADLRNLLRYSVAPARRGLRARPDPRRQYWALERGKAVATMSPDAHATLMPCEAAPL